MKHVIILFMMLVIASCRSNSDTTAEAVEATLTAPEIISPENQTEFVESDFDLVWDGATLANNQRYVVRLWYDDEPPQEIWTQATSINVKDLIDSYSQDVGTYYWQVAVVNTNDDGGFDSMGSDWTTLQELYRVRRLSLTPLPQAQMSDTAQFIHSQNLQSASEIIDFTQTWMYENTHIGAELDIYAPDYSDAADMMFAHFQTGIDAPQMYCNGISTTMLTVLHELGIDSRIVFLYGEVPGWVSEHTILEVFNPDTQRWQAQDPTFNLYYVDSETGERVSIEHMVFGSLATLEGCNADGCNSDANLDEITPRLGAFRYGFSFEVWVNPDRLDISRRVTAFDNANFPEFIANISGTESRNIIFHFDSWEK